MTFRRTLRAVLGTQHRDYQTLRVSRAASGEAEDEITPRIPAAPGNSTLPIAPTNGVTKPVPVTVDASMA